MQSANTPFVMPRLDGLTLCRNHGHGATVGFTVCRNVDPAKQFDLQRTSAFSA